MKDWYPSAEQGFQAAHVGWGAFLTLALAKHLGVAGSMLVIWGLAAVKEFIVDIYVIENDSLAESCRDFIFWTVGILLGAVAGRL